MSDKNPNKNHQTRLDRRKFLRDSSVVAAGTAAGIAVASVAMERLTSAASGPVQENSIADSAPRATSLGQRSDVQRTKPSAPALGRQFARWATGLRYEDLPAAVVDRAKGVTLQAIASVLLGSQFPQGREAVKLITDEESGGRNGATILVSGEKTTKGGAAFANSEMALAGGKWDTFRMLTHPGTSIVPGALVAAETAGVSGREFIIGLAAGYEVMERMASDFIPTVMARGFHAGPVFGIFGGAVAAAKIMGYNENQLNDTIGLCVNLAGGNLESGALREGAAVRNAMLAVALAKQGHPGGEYALEGNAGFYHAYAGNNTGELTYSFTGELRTNLDKITANLGQEWIFLETLYRIYSISGYNIAHIDVTAKLCEEHNIRPEDVDRVEAVVNWLETQYPSPAFPTRREDTATQPGSTRYFTAYGVVKRGFPMLATTASVSSSLPNPPRPSEVPANVAERVPPEVQAQVIEMMKRVTIIPSYQMPLFAPRITIFTKDGKSHTRQGTGREFIWDFNEEARRIRGIIPGLPIPAEQFEQIIAMCRDLDQQPRADKLIQLSLKK